MPVRDSGSAVRVSIDIEGVAVARLLGPEDLLLSTIEREFPAVDVHVHESTITVRGQGSQVDTVRRVIEGLVDLVRGGEEWAAADIIASARNEQTDALSEKIFTESIVTTRGKSIRAKTRAQREYVDAIDKNTIVFGIGPAGTGKTYLAVAKAVQALGRKEVDRIVVTRPAVEAGEKLGFLPGTMTDKVDPYLRPLFDALGEMMDTETLSKLIALGTVEIAPLAYMRGRTLNRSFVILDEAQNTTPEQMKMFLTRLGEGSRMVVTGDITQVDLPRGLSGLVRVRRVLKNVDDIAFLYLSSADVVRHSLVSRIVDAYLADAEREAAAKEREQQ